MSLAFGFADDNEVHAAASDLKTASFNSDFVFYKDNVYFTNNVLPDKTKGLYKVGADMKSFKLIKAGNFYHIKAYKDTLIVSDDSDYLVKQISVTGKVLKEFRSMGTTVSDFEVDGDYIYYYDYKNRSFYQLSIKTGAKKFLTKLSNTYADEYTINNGWLYYVHGNYSDDFNLTTKNLSKIKISSPSKEYKLLTKVKHIDSVIVRDGYIYAVLMKKSLDEGRKLYRMDYSGHKLTRISTQEIGAGPFINNKYIYFGENSFNSNKKLYRMTLDGKNVKTIASFGGRPISVGVASDKNNMYFEIQNGTKYFLKRIVVK